jgi:hypothetical protein
MVVATAGGNSAINHQRQPFAEKGATHHPERNAVYYLPWVELDCLGLLVCVVVSMYMFLLWCASCVHIGCVRAASLPLAPLSVAFVDAFGDHFLSALETRIPTKSFNSAFPQVDQPPEKYCA